MIAFDFAQLRLIGLQQAIASAATQLDVSSPGAQLMRVSAVHRDSISVHDGKQEHPAHVLPRLLHELLAQDTIHGRRLDRRRTRSTRHAVDNGALIPRHADRPARQ